MELSMVRKSGMPILLFLSLLWAGGLFAMNSPENASFPADCNAIFGEPFLHLKESLEKAFPRDDVIVDWMKKTTARHPSILYMMVVDSDNRLINAYFNESLKSFGSDIEAAFMKTDKLSMKEEVKPKTLGDLRIMVSRDKLVIEMDTYYFETGFGPLK